MADSSIQLAQIQLKNFRCFQETEWVIDNPVLLLEGRNGTGKTSILEALHYACYLRSFRTHSPKELITFGQDTFFVKLTVQGSLEHAIQVGFSHNKRLVKVDQKPVSSYKDLVSHYRIVSLTEDDLQLVQGGPQVRRSFIDQAIALIDPSYVVPLREYRQIVDQRNALLQQGTNRGNTYDIITRQLWEKSLFIEKKRCAFLEDITIDIAKLTVFLGSSGTIACLYRPKRSLGESYEAFEANELLVLSEQEKRYGRTLFGAHLDDIVMMLDGKPARLFASRGQQKLIALLLKSAQLVNLASDDNPGIFLLDDFMTDFDTVRVQELVLMLKSLGSQLIFTTPLESVGVAPLLAQSGAQRIQLTY